MTALARTVGLLIALAVGACTFLPWALDRDAWLLSLSSLTSPGVHVATSTLASLGTAVAVAALVILLGVLFNVRAMLLVGGLVAVAIPVVWILVNVVDKQHGLHIGAIQTGAYATVVTGFLSLLLAALASDTREAHVR